MGSVFTMSLLLLIWLMPFLFVHHNGSAAIVSAEEESTQQEPNELCTQLHTKCLECLQEGCFWCPGDGTCVPDNLILYSFNNFSACNQPDDYTQEYCSLPDSSNSSYYYNDPLYQAQSWVFDMIHVQEVWDQGYDGSGIRVRVNDIGIDPNHKEFADRIDYNGSCANGFFMTPEQIQQVMDEAGIEQANHGTAAASIIGAAGNNSVCAMGVAPRVTLSSCSIFSDNVTGIKDFLDSHLEHMDISSNSYGIDGCGATGKPPPFEEEQQQHRNVATLSSNCPFTFQDGILGDTLTFPCTVCDDSVFAPTTITATTISSECEKAILEHCEFYFREDEEGCLDVINVILGGQKCYFAHGGLLPDEQAAVENAIRNGRGGKGVLFVFSSGNSYNKGDSTAFRGWSNSRFIMSVGAVGKDGLHASYSTPGPSLFCVGPAGDFETLQNHITALMGGGGTECTNSGVGTSWSAPVVAGVLALVLQVNPQLTWRDVFDIVATTSSRPAVTENNTITLTDYDDDVTATTNGAGIWHSNLYGFGIINAAQAVQAAQNWTLVGPEQTMTGSTAENLTLAIPDDGTVVTSTLQITSEESTLPFYTEQVVLFLELTHASRGHLQISLTSPQGTTSLLTPGGRPENQVQLVQDENVGNSDRWKMLTLKNWGEDPRGEWTLQISDTLEGDVDECSDYYWEMESGKKILTCTDVEFFKFCLDGQDELDPNQFTEQQYESISTWQFDGRTVTQACCACGGGQASADVKDQLHKWILVIYGRDPTVPANSTNPPTTTSPETIVITNFTVAPTEAPDGNNTTEAPTSQPSTRIPTTPLPSEDSVLVISEPTDQTSTIMVPTLENPSDNDSNEDLLSGTAKNKLYDPQQATVAAAIMGTLLIGTYF